MIGHINGGVVHAIDRVTAFMRFVGVDIGAYRLSLYGLVSTIIVVSALILVVRTSQRLIKWLLRRNAAIDQTQRLLVEKLLGIFLFGIAALVGFDLLGIDLTALTVFSGAFGLAVGFGLQKTIGNLIAGIILLMDRSIKPGDVIVVGAASGGGGADHAATVGRVNRIGIRSVSVVTRDGKEHLIPNELLMTERVENWSYSSRDVRIRMRVPVSYAADLRLAQSLMIAAAKQCPRVLETPAPLVWITAFSDHAVEHELRIWIADPEAGLGNIQGEVFLAIWDAFAANGIVIPFPQVDVHLRPDAPASGPGSGTGSAG